VFYTQVAFYCLRGVHRSVLVRYLKGAHNSRKALIYTKHEHKIARTMFDTQALDIIRRLRSAGYEAYIVGGAIRDVMLGRKPKDIDIVTSAHPQEVRKLFFKSRIIGNRFKLVHVYSGASYYEVATFRAESENSNEFGTLAEDVMRRDFTMNALYYNPFSEELIDFIHGFDDIRKKVIKPIIPLEVIFSEDPVRMLRAVKYAAVFNLHIPMPIKKMIIQQASLLTSISASRLSEEFLKIIKSGSSYQCFSAFESYHLLEYFVPSFHEILNNSQFSDAFSNDLKALDSYIQNSQDKTLDILFRYLLKTVIEISLSRSGLASTREVHLHVYPVVREFLKPLTLPRLGIENAISYYSGKPERAITKKQLLKAKRPVMRRTPS